MNSHTTADTENSQGDEQTSEETEICPEKIRDTDSNEANTDREQVGPRSDEKHLIQILASNEEINRRIAALIEQKQREVDDNNCQEFCGVHPGFQDLENQCARTAAVFVPRAGGKSHIKVSRVVNMYGPQTRALSHAASERLAIQGEQKQRTNLMEGIAERLENMEKHLKITGSSKSDVYSRLKNLEERILFLESLSPEYFTSGPPQAKRSRHDATPATGHNIDQDLSLSEIDVRIQALRDSLLCKSVRR
ncbi:MAP3K12-binding inhibitory protein 1-like [Mercenaria mercenaria]|uniref:MAP3K12-binding inhibitory protein 1-like n=1 Tax=Mercenaria mercenaria TaxID=6596 RepID=UPI00234F6015|nr:MAP3K12-binding inhibitory protein 1-like [Mercenaria mercenaria]XP_053398472.1 MAP3K12-binding inhibitory protein 1-like [Mercenaria mercenaria]